MKLEDLRRVQLIQIQIMDSIHKICVDNNITYYIIGGTALGAVRHKGFIPWDIDIDIAMPRDDYERFIHTISKLLPEQYICYSSESERNYYPPHALVALKGSSLIQRNDYLNPTLKRYGIFIDIFPLDQAPNGKAEQKKQADGLRKLTTAKQRKMAITYSENSALVRLAKRTLKSMYFLISIDELNKKQQKLMQKYNSEPDCRFWCSMASHYRYEKQCMPKEIYGTPILTEFEGREYFAPQKIHEYLTRIYGNYMVLPSEREQQKQMDYFIEAHW